MQMSYASHRQLVPELSISPVAENVRVAEGDILFQIDLCGIGSRWPKKADLDLAEAAIDTQRRVLLTHRSAAIVATDQVKCAIINLELATRTVERVRPLAATRPLSKGRRT